jgi:flagellum-specific peptidoglycan hydrolase FlgJ
MKVILKEEQIQSIILTEQVYKILNESIIDDFNLASKNVKKLIMSGVATGVILAAISSLNISKEQKDELRNIVNLERQDNSRISYKIKACSDYMEKALSNQGFKISDTKLTPQALVKASEDYSFDLPLLMAAAHLESCFGATNRAKKTNSVFSVGSYDNGKNVVTYSHPNESINGYIKLLLNDYLINGKTINDLLKPGGFVNKNGDRYASKKNYEKLLKSVRNRIIQNYPELI